jgi:hypothetical protein
LRGHALGGHADERFLVFAGAGIGQDLDIDIVPAQLELLEGEPDRVLDGYCLNFDAGKSIVASHCGSLVLRSSGRADEAIVPG